MYQASFHSYHQREIGEPLSVISLLLILVLLEKILKFEIQKFMASDIRNRNYVVQTFRTIFTQ